MLLAGDRQSLRGRARRRSAEIHVYVGHNGSGKSLAAVYDTLPDLEAGRPVLSTIRLLDWQNPRPCDDPACDYLDADGAHDHLAAHPLWVPFTRWDQLLQHRHGPVLMDEVTGVADSGDATLPPAVQEFLQQLRRHDVCLRVTGLDWMNVNKRIRQGTLAVTRCRSHFPVRTKIETMWRPRRFGLWTTYDAQTLPRDDHTDHAYKSARKLVRSRQWIPSNPAVAAYVSTDPVLRIGTVSDRGRCASCGGTRRAPVCTCADYRPPERDRSSRPSGGPRVRGADGRGGGPAPVPEGALG